MLYCKLAAQSTSDSLSLSLKGVVQVICNKENFLENLEMISLVLQLDSFITMIYLRYLENEYFLRLTQFCTFHSQGSFIRQSGRFILRQKPFVR